jgi:hypothetical protein
MASIIKQRTIQASSDEVWDALRDWGALHERLAPGFVVDARLDGADRIVTFFNDIVVRERPVAIDDEHRRLVWSIVEGPYAHHNGAAQVIANEDGTTQFVWTADLLPDELAEPTAEIMERGLDTMKATLEAAAARV